MVDLVGGFGPLVVNFRCCWCEILAISVGFLARALRLMGAVSPLSGISRFPRIWLMAFTVS